MKRIDERLHRTSHPCRLLPGKSTPAMAVVRTDDGVLLYSPTPIDDALQAEIESLGPVRWIIAPNPFHNLYVVAAAERFPQATVILANAVTKRAPACASIANVADTDELPRIPGVELLRMPFKGGGEELVALWNAEQTVFFADGMFNVHEAASAAGRLSFQLFAMYQKPVVSWVMRLMLADKKATAAIFERLADAGVTRIVACHGPVVDTDVQPLLRTIAASF